VPDSTASAIFAPDMDLRRRLLILGVFTAAQGEMHGGDDAHQQDHRGQLERIDVFGVEQTPEFAGIAVAIGQGLTGQSLDTEVFAAEHQAHFDHHQHADHRTERQIAPETMAQAVEVDIEHHDDEQE
jgi:hypothetical protein